MANSNSKAKYMRDVQMVSPTGAVFSGRVFRSQTGKEFTVWELGIFKAAFGEPVKVTSISYEGAQNPIRAAAYNLENKLTSRSRRFWFNVVDHRKVLGRKVLDKREYITVSVPGASVHVPGYEAPQSLSLSVTIDNPACKGLAVNEIAADIRRAVARGVYAVWPKTKETEATEDTIPEMPEL